MNNYIVRKLSQINFDFWEKIFFALFLLSIPLQTRLTLLTPETYQNGQFNEYATFFIYLSDIFLVTTLLLYFVNKLTKTKDFSITQTRFYTSPHLIPMVFLSGFLLWSILSVRWAEYPNVALFQSLKLSELVLLALYIGNRLLWFGLNKAFTLIFVTGTFQALIGIGQYLTQKSLGLKILGESILAPSIDNVAKIVVDNERFIRAYGTFPHPNVFAAFLILSISCGFWLLLSAKIKGNNQIVSHLPAVVSTILNFLASLKGKKAIVSRETIYGEAKEGETILIGVLTFAVILQIFAFILTFSRVAWFGAAVMLIVFLTSVDKLFHACPPKLLQLKKWLNQNKITELFHVKQFYGLRRMVKQFWNNSLNKIQKYSIVAIIFSFIVITGMFWNQITSRTIDSENKYQQSADYRVLYSNVAIKMIEDQPLTGTGNGNFTLKMNDYSPIPLEWWQYQPAHNIYLLITSELGLIGLLLFVFFIFFLIKVACSKVKNQIVSSSAALKIVSRETIYDEAKDGKTFWFKRLTLSIFIVFLFMGLFDHYFWTLQQGRITFWLVIGALLASSSE